MNKLLCLLHLHFYGSWYAINEVPIWRRGSLGDDRKTVVGNQPVKQQLYSDGKGGTILKYEPDIHFFLIGKVIEQRRTCIRPGRPNGSPYSQSHLQRAMVAGWAAGRAAAELEIARLLKGRPKNPRRPGNLKSTARPVENRRGGATSK